MKPEASPATLALSHILQASPEVAFDLWTEPRAIQRWFGGLETEVEQVDIDLQVGGRYLIQMPGERGPTEVIGEFLVVERPNKLVYTWTMRSPGSSTNEMTVDVEFVPDPRGTLIVLRHGPFQAQEVRELHNAGWLACLAAMEQILDGRPPTREEG